MKRILVLTASPRKGGNSDLMADAFIEGARKAGHEVVKFETAFLSIGGCDACDKCWSKDSACVIGDDFRKLEPMLESCEVLAIASPLYWFALPAQIKGALDRLYAYGGAGGPRPLAIKESVLMLSAGDTAEVQFSGVKLAYKMTGEFLGWKDRGVIIQGGINEKGEVQNTPALEKAMELGKNI